MKERRKLKRYIQENEQIIKKTGLSWSCFFLIFWQVIGLSWIADLMPANRMEGYKELRWTQTWKKIMNSEKVNNSHIIANTHFIAG